MDLVNVAQLAKFAPHAIAPEQTAEALSQHMARCEINTARRIRHFMAQLFVESGGFTTLEENMNYSAPRLMQVWPSRFPTIAATNGFARNPRALAGKVYNGRLGNTSPLDGWMYRGGGWIQLTGKDNYKLASEWTGVDLVKNPDLARTSVFASQIACDYWRVKNLNAVVDADADEKVLKSLYLSIKYNEADNLENETKIINGGLTDFNARESALLAAGRIWK